MPENPDNPLGYDVNIPKEAKSIQNIEDDKNTSTGYKKTSVGLPPDLLPLLEASPMNQSQTIVAALKFYFSDDRQKLLEFPKIITGYESRAQEYENILSGYQSTIKGYEGKVTEYENRIVGYDKEIAVLKAQIEELIFIKQEYNRLHELIDELKGISKAHMTQVQTLIEERKKQDYIIQQKDEKILQLQEANKVIEAPSKKRKWYQFWK